MERDRGSHAQWESHTKFDKKGLLSSTASAVPSSQHPQSQVPREAEPLQIPVIPIVLWLAIFYLITLSHEYAKVPKGP